MIETLLRRLRPPPAPVEEHLDGVSADLPYELQSKLFDQLATVALGGAGLTVTLIGSVLQDAPPLIWVAVAGFGIAAFTAIDGNIKLIRNLLARAPTLRRSKSETGKAMFLIGISLGILSMAVYDVTGKEPASAAARPSERP